MLSSVAVEAHPAGNCVAAKGGAERGKKSVHTGSRKNMLRDKERITRTNHDELRNSYIWPIDRSEGNERII